ncbi:MAG TPA: S26 family signal peptidase [Thermoplasmata archaeon]|nr:S26 family signal peptidase [Thermoplasmata archaeon]
MPPRRSRPAADDEEDEEETTPRRLHPPAGRSPRKGHRRPPPRRWDADDEEDEDDDADDDDDDLPLSPRRRGRRTAEEGPPGKDPVYFRARDSVYFEPLLAVAIMAVLLAGLFAYTQNWPPMYVVESNSMQHGASDQLGLINTGDLVLAQKVSITDVTPYEVGLQTGYTTYGEFGDVVLYHPNGDTSVAPIIHRALLYIEVDSDGTYSFPALAGQACGNATDAVYSVSSTSTGCGAVHVSGTLTLYHVGWRSVLVSVDLASLGRMTGLLTMGDNNFDPTNSSIGDPDQPGLSTLVQPSWVVGVARGMLPWFGSLKLLTDGRSGEVPSQSWEWMGLTVVGLILVALGIHWFLRAEGIEDERRKADEAEARRAAGGRRSSSGRWHWPHPIQDWRDEHDDEDEDDEDEPPSRSRRSAEPPRRRSWFGGGRPKPAVGRRKRSKAHSSDSDDDL